MIEFCDITHAFGARTVLREVSLTLPEHRIGIVGANGSGKSTLVRMINALVIPDHGSVTVNGIDARHHKRRVRREVGFIFSDPDRQIIMPTVAEDIELSLTRTDLSRTERAERTRTVLDRFGLADHANSPAGRLSGGQKQLLALASVFVTQPAVIVADEPTTLLDLRNARMLRTVFAGLTEQLIVVSHDLDLVADFDRVLVMDDGRIVADDEPTPALRHYRKMMT
ncbi:ABC transporter ATP-binding protein [Gordonia oryzae]|uniref:ABC transporter ATP-binding protein n=1 Tax=Gordonia oryzae TaxID=2487349 RepID=A0A3N4GWZ9_9ACTN|nr:ABC transporter ATP-binding protein [Gordonia oryzae]RPA65226.1 ABC transporter ATP-binding protein [Gordonia oryzae]